MMRALVVEQNDGVVESAVREVDEAELPAGDVRVAVEYSSLNYKDGMVIRGLGRLVKRYPHVPGIDLAGVVEASDDARFTTGDRVICTGFRVGELWWGGYAQKAALRADWLVPLPDGLTTKRAMAIGTAGLAAMLGVMALEARGVTPDSGDVLVTGASGGVGSVAVALLARLGYRAVASTGRVDDQGGYLRELGAAEIIDRRELSAAPAADRPLDSARWAGCIDNVGSTTLARVLTQMKQRGAVASIGLAAGPELHTTVVPFLLRGVALIGIDTNAAPMAERLAAWPRLAELLDGALLDALTTVEPLDRLPELADAILDGRVRGRTVIDVNG